VLRTQPNDLLKLIIIIIIIVIIIISILYFLDKLTFFYQLQRQHKEKGQQTNKIKQNKDRSKAKDKTTVRVIIKSNLKSKLEREPRKIMYRIIVTP
jgi:anionic cell wall polymer biosynthesis LytR-Cps2A-Psr (LCP) family protein